MNDLIGGRVVGRRLGLVFEWAPVLPTMVFDVEDKAILAAVGSGFARAKK